MPRLSWLPIFYNYQIHLELIMRMLLRVALSLLGLMALVTIAQAQDSEPRIVGGKVSLSGQWPWMTALVWTNPKTGKPFSNPWLDQFCGGSLIDASWVITAGHCVDEETTASFSVIAHLHNLQKDSGEIIAVKRIIIHPDYNNTTLNHDIALVQLQKPVTNAQVLPLISGNPLLTGVNATIIGWGALSEENLNNGIYPKRLHEAQVPIVTNAACKKSYGNHQIDANKLCAGLELGGKDACGGDSGGPLIVKQNQSWVLAGITSNGTGCAEPLYYGIYMRVSKYLNFIKENQKANFKMVADVNQDQQIDEHDKSAKKAQLHQAFVNWTQHCWKNQAICADVNADGVFNVVDYALQRHRLNKEFRRWLSVYWQPEVSQK